MIVKGASDNGVMVYRLSRRPGAPGALESPWHHDVSALVPAPI